MSLWKKILNFYVQSSLHVALAVVSLAGAVALEMEWPLTTTAVALLITATISGYNFVKFAGIARLHHQSLTQNLRLIQVFSFVAGGLLIYLLFQQSVNQLWLLVILAIVNFLYAIPFLPKDKNLRSLRGIKIFVIALIWSLAVVIYPGADRIDNFFQVDIILRVLQVFMLVFAITLPFEIRDIETDQAELGTVPQTIGVRKTRILGYALLAVFLILSFFLNESILATIPEILVCGASLWAITSSRPNAEFYRTAFWVEGIPILWWVAEQLLRLF